MHLEAIWYPPTIRVNSQNRNEIKEGDTLWGIATEYRGDDYDSIYDYIDEVMSINGLTSDQIHAGQYLTVAYYDTQAR